MAEGAPLLRAYTLTGIEGSNPSLSAKYFLGIEKQKASLVEAFLFAPLYPLGHHCQWTTWSC